MPVEGVSPPPRAHADRIGAVPPPGADDPPGGAGHHTGGMELLLLSNSTNYGGSMFSHAAEACAEVAAGATVAFIPYALADWDDYADRATAAFGAFGIEVASVHRSSAPDRAILDAEVVMMGGGNTFRLLDSLLTLDVVDGLGMRVRAGDTRYMGASAGTNVACPTIRTTNDMPICVPPTFEALGLIPFQINLHYIDRDPDSTFMGESREERIVEFLEENDCPVVAMYEGAWLRVSGGEGSVTGRSRLFRRGSHEAFDEHLDVSHLLTGTPRFDDGRRPGPGGHRRGTPAQGR
jgi:dipeptidase E